MNDVDEVISFHSSAENIPTAVLLLKNTFVLDIIFSKRKGNTAIFLGI